MTYSGKDVLQGCYWANTQPQVTARRFHNSNQEDLLAWHYEVDRPILLLPDFQPKNKRILTYLGPIQASLDQKSDTRQIYPLS